MKNIRFALSGVMLTLLFAGAALSDDNDHSALLPQLANSPLQVVSTVPSNGDLNPYGVAFVPQKFAAGGTIQAGDILVSNFNNSANFQGTGSTIVAIGPHGSQNLFFPGTSPASDSPAALGVLRRGVVLVGNLPTTDGSFGTVQQGSLIAVDRFGKQIASFTDATTLDGPWDMALIDGDSTAIAFVSSALNGTVSRLEFDVSADGEHITLSHASTVAAGYTHRGDPAALVIGPTGLAWDRQRNVLYVASTGDNAIYAVDAKPQSSAAAGKGRVVYQDDTHLRGPVGLMLASNGHLIATNGDAVNGDPTQPSEMVEFTREGKFVSQVSVDSAGQGGAFGIAMAGPDDNERFAAVDDVVNTLKVWQVPN